MSDPGSILRKRATTVHSEDPVEIRRESTRLLRETIDCDVALFFRCARNEETDIIEYNGPITATDSPCAESIVDQCNGEVLDAPWLPPHLDPKIVDTFIRTRSFYKKSRLDSYEVQRRLIRPLGICDQMRMVVYDGDRFLGWLGLMRKSTTFSNREQQIVCRAVSQFKSNIANADALESGAANEGLFAVFSSDGRLEHASHPFADWLDEERTTYLRQRIRDVDTGTSRGGIEIAVGAEVRVTRLDATGSTRYLVNVEHPELLRVRPEYWLTERQLEIAKFAVAGATTSEIADTLDISPHTVKTHLKNAYARLGIGSRTELATMLSASDSASR